MTKHVTVGKYRFTTNRFLRIESYPGENGSSLVESIVSEKRVKLLFVDFRQN